MAVSPLESAPVYEGPLPHPTPESALFWEACTRHELRMQRCLACGVVRFPPGNRCPACWSDRAEWQALSGRGTIYTFTVMRRAYHRGLADKLPYVVAVVDLEEGPRMVSNVVDCPVDQVRVGDAVEVVFDDVTPEVTLPKFRPRVTT